MAKDLRAIYEAATEQEGTVALEEFAEKRDKRYPHISASWKMNWDEIVTFFKYPPEIRSLIYTTNPIESLNRQVKRPRKTRRSSPASRPWSSRSAWPSKGRRENGSSVTESGL